LMYHQCQLLPHAGPGITCLRRLCLALKIHQTDKSE
jgi:hypothetical protein